MKRKKGSKRKTNPILDWIEPEQSTFRSTLKFGLIALILLSVVTFTGIFGRSSSDKFIYVLIGIFALLYGISVFKVYRSYQRGVQDWERLTEVQQKELARLLEEEDVTRQHVVPATEFVLVYAKQSPRILFFDEITWVYTFQDKRPQTSTTYVEPNQTPSQHPLAGDNYLVLFDESRKKILCYAGKETLPYYTYLAKNTPNALHGYSKEKSEKYYQKAD